MIHSCSNSLVNWLIMGRGRRIVLAMLLAVGWATIRAAGNDAATGSDPAAGSNRPTGSASSPAPDASEGSAARSGTASQSGSNSGSGSKSGSSSRQSTEPPRIVPWDFDPYRVSVWIAADDPKIQAEPLLVPLRDFLDRDFSAIWRLSVRDAPASVGSIMQRDLSAIDYGVITSTDPVVAIKRDHKDAVRIQTAANVAELVQRVYATDSAMESLGRLGDLSGDATVGGIVNRLQSVGDNTIDVSEKWADPGTEAVLLPRGLAMRLDNPKPKVIKPPVDGLVVDILEGYDKVYFVNVKTLDVFPRIEVTELDVLQRHFGPVHTVALENETPMTQSMGRALTAAFSPVVRIDNAGKNKTAQGLIRAGGLILDKDSPGLLRPGDVLQPMVRKNDRNGVPFVVGPIEWAYLVVDEVNERVVQMDFFAGRTGGLQGRKNKRTFRTAVRVAPTDGDTTLRLHARGKPDFPLIGYEVYQRELKGKKTTFIGRTNWDGRLKIDKTEDPLRLLYVKNGGAILARLPVVPGLFDTATADLRGDDLRLQAEAYIRGVQNSIIDLVAVRELFKARINLRLKRGEIDKAKELLARLQGQPDNQALADDMGKKQTVFITLLENEGANQRRKVDGMFSVTRDLLTKHINPRVIRELEAAVIAAERGETPPAGPDSETP